MVRGRWPCGFGRPRGGENEGLRKWRAEGGGRSRTCICLVAKSPSPALTPVAFRYRTQWLVGEGSERRVQGLACLPPGWGAPALVLLMPSWPDTGHLAPSWSLNVPTESTRDGNTRIRARPSTTYPIPATLTGGQMEFTGM